MVGVCCTQVDASQCFNLSTYFCVTCATIAATCACVWGRARVDVSLFLCAQVWSRVAMFTICVMLTFDIPQLPLLSIMFVGHLGDLHADSAVRRVRGQRGVFCWSRSNPWHLLDRRDADVLWLYTECRFAVCSLVGLCPTSLSVFGTLSMSWSL